MASTVNKSVQVHGGIPCHENVSLLLLTLCFLGQSKTESFRMWMEKKAPHIVVDSRCFHHHIIPRKTVKIEILDISEL